MKKKFMSLLLAVVLCLGLLPAAASAAENKTLPDWYFLFAIFKNVDADVKDKNGKTQHLKWSMPQEEVDTYRGNASDFEKYLTETGVMRAHVDVVEIDTAVTELEEDGNGPHLWMKQAAPLLEEARVDLDRYDHVTCLISLNIGTEYVGLSGGSYENGTGHVCINTKNWKFSQEHFVPGSTPWTLQVAVHEYLHFMESLTKNFGTRFNLHDIRSKFYSPDTDNGKECYTAIIQNRAKGTAGTGVHPAAWQYPPRVRRTMTELKIPSGVTGIGTWAFGNRTNLTKVSIPVSVKSIEYAAFWDTGIKEVYYEGTEAQWKAIQIGEYNGPLTKANIHYQSPAAPAAPAAVSFSDVAANSPFRDAIAWAVNKGVTSGKTSTTFAPGETCTQAQILTFLWRAKGSPAPDGAVADGKYYASAVQWAKEQGITGEAFSADTPCTRAMAVTYLWKLAGSPQAGAAGFKDVAADAPWAQAVSWAVEKGVTSGTGADTFSPDAACTRGQIVTFLYRALK